jgi:hypothetical protein
MLQFDKLMSYLRIITPTNIEEERDKFFSNTNYLPQFKYDWSNINTDKLSDEDQKLLSVLLSQNTHDITAFGEKYFDIQFRDADIEYAKLRVKEIPQKEVVTAEKYAECAQQLFKEFDIDYKVEIVNKHGFQGRPDHKHKVLRLSKFLKPEFYSVEGLVKHELVHIIRSLNGEYNNVNVQPGYLGTDEGLAAFVQDNLLQTQTSSLFMHSVEYLAAHIAKEHGFLDVYRFLVSNGSSPESAWLRGIRQKFGLCDTSQPGGLMKSAMQYCYEMKIKELNKDDLLKLFIGKVRLNQIDEYAEYKGMFSKEKIYSLFE